MKKILLMMLCMAAGMSMYAQKFGHIYSDSLLMAMPEKATAEEKLRTLAKQYQDAIDQKDAEFSQKYQSYVQLDPSTPDIIRADKEQELTRMQQGMQEFAVTMQNKLEEERERLMTPVYEKARVAIQSVAKENGYTYVFDASTGVTLYEGGDNIINLVKAELGIQ